MGKDLRKRATRLKITRRANGTYIDREGKTYSKDEGLRMLRERTATLSEWHGGKKTDRVSYEGGQYAGGRKTGRKNLVKLDDGSVQNQHGVVFTQEEKKALESAVNTANRKRMKMLEKEGQLPRMKGGVDTGDTVRSLQSMGKESDFILARKSKSLQQFRSREDFEIYLDNVRRVNSPDYLDERTRQYKRNHMKALENVFGDEAKGLIMKIRMMPPEEYRELLQSDEDMEIGFIYDPSDLSARLEQMQNSIQAFQDRKNTQKRGGKGGNKKVKN